MIHDEFNFSGKKVLLIGGDSDILSVLAKWLSESGAELACIENSGRGKNAPEVTRKIKNLGAIDIAVNVFRSESKFMNQTYESIFSTMKEQRRGVILSILSPIEPRDPVKNEEFASIFSRGSVISFSKVFAKKAGPFNIRVNTVISGVIKKVMNENREAFEEDIINYIPLRRLGTPEDVAGVALFLISDMASYITGEVISVNGGLPSSLLL